MHVNISSINTYVYIRILILSASLCWNKQKKITLSKKKISSPSENATKKNIRIDFNGRTMSKFYIFGSNLNFTHTTRICCVPKYRKFYTHKKRVKEMCGSDRREGRPKANSNRQEIYEYKRIQLLVAVQ